MPQNLGNWDYFEVKDDLQPSAFTSAGLKRDAETYAQANHLERMYGAWEAMGAPEEATMSAWTSLESTIASWITGGKMNQTGQVYPYINDSSRNSVNALGSNQELFSRCATYNLDAGDYVTMARINSGDHGVESIEMQSLKHP